MSEQDDATDEKEASAESTEEAAPRKKRTGSRKAREREQKVSAPPAASAGSRALLVGALALAVGVAGGWFGRDAQAKARLRAESSPAAAGSAGPCGAWEQKICASSGEQSAACHQAKGAADLLTSGTCERALETMPATLAKLKAARVPCDQLVAKLCADLPPGSQACGLVKERTPSFPADRCQEMLQNYDAVLGELKGIDQQMAESPQGGGMPMGMPPHGMPPQGMPPHGMPPGAAPQAPPAGAP